MSAPRVTPAPTPIAYSLAGAAQAIGHDSTWEIKRAIKSGSLTARFANSKPIIGHDELKAWFDNLPVDKPSPQ